jgi:hypothetical protein
MRVRLMKRPQLLPRQFAITIGINFIKFFGMAINPFFLV